MWIGMGNVRIWNRATRSIKVPADSGISSDKNKLETEITDLSLVNIDIDNAENFESPAKIVSSLGSSEWRAFESNEMLSDETIAIA